MAVDKRNGAVVGGWCCIILAVLIGMASPALFLLYVPLAMAAFVLAIIAMAQRRITHGVFMLLLSILVPVGILGYGASSGWRTITQVADSAPASAGSAAAALAATRGWQYTTQDDPMGRGADRAAAITSTNTVDFSFPYAGPQHARLALVNSARYKHQVRLDIERGQFTCSGYNGCALHARVDDRKAVRFTAAPAANGDATSLFVVDADGFVRALRGAHTLRVEAEFWQEGSTVFTFDVTGLDAARIGL